MSKDKTAAKSHKNPHSHFTKLHKSPDNNHGSQQTIAQRESQFRLQDKIYKLKSALKAAEKHNEELHRKIKIYKLQSTTSTIPDEEIRIQLNKAEANGKVGFQIGMGMIAHRDKQATQISSEKDIRPHSIGKVGFSYANIGANSLSARSIGGHSLAVPDPDSKIRQLEIQIKTKDMKIVQLEGLIKDLKIQIEEKNKEIKETVKNANNLKNQKTDQEIKRMGKYEDQLQIKAAECQQHCRQILKLKESLKDSVKKVQKMSSQVLEHTQRIKQQQQQLKQSRKLVGILQKEQVSLREASQKMKQQGLQQIAKNRNLQKKLLEMEFNLKSKQEKYETLSKNYDKKEEEFQSLLLQYREVSEKKQAILTEQYELHRDFERELHTIVKEITRRHIVSKNLVANVNSARNTYENDYEIKIGHKGEYK